MEEHFPHSMAKAVVDEASKRNLEHAEMHSKVEYIVAHGINLVMQMITGFMVFTQGYIITEGGPLNSTLFYVVYLYQTTFENFKAGRGAAMAWMLLLFVGILTAILFGSSKYWVFEEND